MIDRGLYIGIDPDIDRSGLCVLDADRGEICYAASLPFSDIVAKLKTVRDTYQATGRRVIVVVEASWRELHNWHLGARDSPAAAGRKGYYVGRNHQTGILICDAARALGLRVVEQAPLTKSWRGHDRKITAPEFAEVTGWVKRTNQEVRDAGLLAWTAARLPIQINRK